MRTRVVTLCLVVALVGCETSPTYSSSRKEQMTVLHPGDAVVSALGTPFYLAFKSVTCVLSAAIAAPVAGIAALSESHFAPEIRRGLGDGINENCGPPYVLSPYRAVPVEPTADVPETTAPGKAPGASSGVPDVPVLPQSLDPSAGPPPDHSAAPTTEEAPEPAAGEPIVFSNM
jgi:hypothetical protein